jgi:hypothetical protein
VAEHDDGPVLQPGVEMLRVAQLRQLAPAADEGLLHRVLREGRVAEDQHGDGVEAIDDRRGEVGEGGAVAASRPLDQVGPHHRRTLPSPPGSDPVSGL